MSATVLHFPRRHRQLMRDCNPERYAARHPFAEFAKMVGTAIVLGLFWLTIIVICGVFQ